MLPLILVFVEAFKQGLEVYVQALIDPDTLSAVKLTLLTAAIAVPINVIFGVAAAWAVSKFQFKGKAILTTIIDMPFRFPRYCRFNDCSNFWCARLVRRLVNGP